MINLLEIRKHQCADNDIAFDYCLRQVVYQCENPNHFASRDCGLVDLGVVSI